MLKVGLNGFGRIGRAIFRINKLKKRFKIVAINDIDPNVENHAYLLKYDSIYGRIDEDLSADNKNMRMNVNGETVCFFNYSNIVDVPWGKCGIDVLIDASGSYQNVISGRQLINKGVVKKIVVSHSPKDGVDHTIIFGVNKDSYNPEKHHIISTSTCDANANAPVLKILEKKFGVKQGYITTLHPWLSYQNLLDGTVRSVSNPGHFWNDFSLGRDSTRSLIPKNTTLVEALKCVLPEVSSRLNAISFRVPTGIVSASDLTITLQQKATVDELKELFHSESKKNSEIIGYKEEPLVSIDFAGIQQSLFVDGRWMCSNSGNNIKLVLWYDNEWGYSQRVVDMVSLISKFWNTNLN